MTSRSMTAVTTAVTTASASMAALNSTRSPSDARPVMLTVAGLSADASRLSVICFAQKVTVGDSR
jgi:hypothetical protein